MAWSKEKMRDSVETEEGKGVTGGEQQEDL